MASRSILLHTVAVAALLASWMPHSEAISAYPGVLTETQPDGMCQWWCNTFIAQTVKLGKLLRPFVNLRFASDYSMRSQHVLSES